MSLDLFDVASALGDCVCEQLAKPRPNAANPEAPGWRGKCCVLPGAEAAFDECCEKGGQSWVVALDGWPTIVFPNNDAAGSTLSCADGHTMATRFEVGAIRCVCTMQNDGSPCPCDRSEADALAVMGDLEAILIALDCCFADNRENASTCRGRDWRLQSFELIGPEGGCAGARATIVVRTKPICCSRDGVG